MSLDRRYRLRWVDVFTDRALAGNPLAVVLQAEGLSTPQMQAIARETNLSETTFVLPPETAGHAARVRIFTPHVELPFAGHPTIGTGWVLLDEGIVAKDATSFVLEEGVGPVPVRGDRSGQTQRLWMTHPPVRYGEVIDERHDIATALGLATEDLLVEVPIQVVSTGVPFLYVAIKDARRRCRGLERRSLDVRARRARPAARLPVCGDRWEPPLQPDVRATFSDPDRGRPGDRFRQRASRRLRRSLRGDSAGG